MHRPLTLAVLSAATLAIAGPAVLDATPAHAAPLGYSTSTIAQQDILFTVDVETGEMVEVGGTGVTPATRGLTMSPGGVLYGSQDGDLYTYDGATGDATLVGPMGCCGIVEDLTFDAAGRLWALSSNPSNLWSVDVATGSTTLVGPLGHGLMTGLAADCSGNVYGTDNQSDVLVRVDTADPSASTVVGAFGVDVGSGSLTFDGDGTLWMMMRPAMPAGAPSQTRTVDLTTGALSPMVASVAGNNPSDLALGPLVCPDVPEPGPQADVDPSPTMWIDGTSNPTVRPVVPVVVTPRFTG